jgi:hypothetical protein
MSADVTARFTGGLECTFVRMCTVRVLPPSVIPRFEVVGMNAAMSGLTVESLSGG